MDDEVDALSNFCVDLVALRRLEPALVHLFRDIKPGQWTSVRELYELAVQSNPSIKSLLVAAWLPTPGADSDHAIVVFFDEESKWSLTADYNVSRLLHQTTRSQIAAAS